jgi:hypothetical protein
MTPGKLLIILGGLIIIGVNLSLFRRNKKR